VSDDEIKISARGLLELLSGKVTQERFFELHDWRAMANPFSAQQSQGRLITEIRVEHNEKERDDNRLTIRFGNPEPAISPFRLPS
jgi:hypothetical protein